MADFEGEYGAVACEQVVVTTESDFESYEFRAEPKAALSSSNKKRRGNLPKKSVDIMRQWLTQHMHHAYPSDKDKMYMARMGGLSPRQVCNWFINARRRLLPALCEKHGISPDAQVMFRSRQLGGVKDQVSARSPTLQHVPAPMARRAEIRQQAGLFKSKPVVRELLEAKNSVPVQQQTDDADGYVSDASTKSALSDSMDFEEVQKDLKTDEIGASASTVLQSIRTKVSEQDETNAALDPHQKSTFLFAIRE